MRRDEAMSALTPITLTSFTGLPGAGNTTRLELKETVNKPSQRRKPVSSALTLLDSGFRRNDLLRLDQRLFKNLLHQPAQPRNFVEKAYARYWALEALKARP